MTVRKKIEDGTMTVYPEGRLDTLTAPELENELSDSLGGVSSLVFDMSGLEYISSAGLRVLLYAGKKLGGSEKITVTNLNETVSEIFEITGFSDIVKVK